MQPRFLAIAEILEIHRDQIERHGGDYGLRDVGLLGSALAMPRAGSRGQYFHEGLQEMAAAYAFHLMRNRPFADGNKRVGAVAAVVFLKLNDVRLKPDEGGYEALIMGVANGRTGKAEIAEFFWRNTDERCTGKR
ncbi:MAG TPA: type II toxin-antitoxin system death-on-curing family toxin [Planctomycetota bacterium]|nr:type II toxin-antitoxin system death-on-curing family toxin [Planctomycetota bacterium]